MLLVNNNVQKLCFDLISNTDLPKSILVHTFNLLSSLIPYMDEEDLASVPITAN